MKDKKSLDVFSTMSVPQAVIKNAIPAMVAMLMVLIYNLADTFFICSSVLAIGIPASLASVLMSVSQIIMNGLMAGYGDMAIAGIGVAMKVTMITGMIAMGIGQGIQPLLGYCVGARTWERYRKIMRFSMWFAFLLGLTMTVFCYFFTDQIASAFLTEERAFDYAVQFAKILLSTSTLFGVFYVLTNALQAMGAAVSSLIINLSRQGLIYIPALFILQAALGVSGLVWAQPVADILSIGLAVGLYAIHLEKHRGRSWWIRRYRQIEGEGLQRGREHQTEVLLFWRLPTARKLFCVFMG